MADSARDQLDALRQQIDREAPLAADPLVTATAQQGRALAGMLTGSLGDQANQLAGLVRARPISTVLATFFAAYVVGRIGRWL